ncbi:hypothetical protein [Dongia sp.]|uniref:hypothetical protein n=1 Tax=Dongia sp. TaxID=1977262 RepID=UPI0035B4C0F9
MLRRPARHLLLLVLVTAGFAAPLLVPSQMAQALENEVECSSLRLQMQGEDYDLICSADNVSDVSYETLEANAADGSHFLVVNDARTNFQYIFESRGLRQSLTSIYSDLDVSNWTSGKGEQGLTTSEFDSDYKTVRSACVGFQKYTSRDQWGGWRRHIIGFGCSRTGNRQQVYDALSRIKFPH